MSDFELPAGAERKSSKKASLPSTSVETPPTETEVETPKSAYDKEEMLRIFDEIIFSGEYIEHVKIRGKLNVGFRTRTAAELEEISLVVDSMTANLITTLNERRSILNLQYALVSYQGKDLKGLKTEDRAKFVRNLPGPVIGALLQALMKFDEKIFEACREGEENF